MPVLHEPKPRQSARPTEASQPRPRPSNETQGALAVVSDSGLLLPHERDESVSTVAEAPDPVIAQAKRDIDAGLVDTDMRATPGLDANRRAKLVPGAGGKPPGSRQ